MRYAAQQACNQAGRWPAIAWRYTNITPHPCGVGWQATNNVLLQYGNPQPLVVLR